MKEATEVAEELNDRLRRTDQPYITLPWADFYALCERERIKQPFKDSIQQEASGRYQLAVAYGQNVVIVCPDRNVAPTHHWVAARAACQIDAVFEEMVKAVQQDVGAINHLPANQRGPYQYKYDRRYEEQAIVFRTDEFGHILPIEFASNVAMAVIFEKVAGIQSVQIRQNLTERSGRKQAITVTPRWNAEKLSCELIWDDDTDHPLGVQEVSQKALEPLFFDTDQ